MSQPVEATDKGVVDRFLDIAATVENGDSSEAHRAYGNLLRWPAEEKEELIFRTDEKYASEKRSVIALNNQVVERRFRDRAPDNVLMLLPFCLQRRDCPRRVVWDISNCRRCGRCPIGPLLDLAEKYGTEVRIAIRARFAPDFVMELRPALVFAVACEHELLAGIIRVAPYDCYCVLNQRPEGPCKNTLVDTALVEKELASLLRRRRG